MPAFNSATATQAAHASHAQHSRRFTDSRRAALKQAVSLQVALHDAGLVLSADVEKCEDREERARVVTALASAAKGWQSLQDQVRILRGDPLPGSLRPESLTKQRKIAIETVRVLDNAADPPSVVRR